MRLTLRISPLIGFYLVYILLSTLLFFGTTRGWRVIIEMYHAPVLLVCWLFLPVARLFGREAFVPARLFWSCTALIVAVQIPALVFNIGDCWDGAGVYNYIQTVNQDVAGTRCDRSPVIEPLVSEDASLGIRWFYYLLNFCWVILIFASVVKRNREPSKL